VRERESVIRIESCGFLFAPSNTYMTGQEHYKLLLFYSILFYSILFILFYLFCSVYILNSLGHMCSNRLRSRNDSRLNSRSLSNPIFHLHTQYSTVQYSAVCIYHSYGVRYIAILPPCLPASLYPILPLSYPPSVPLSIPACSQ
jgi:hypothetical protein